jgi:hypothetical protein
MLPKYIRSIGLVARDKDPFPTWRSDSDGMGVATVMDMS